MCEKLSKECVFESVSSNSRSPTESRHAHMSRASAGHRLASSSSSSSSAMSNGHTVDIHAAQPRESMTMPALDQLVLADPPGLKSESISTSPSSSFVATGIVH